MKLTSELLHAAATRYSGFTKAQLEVLGIAWPPKRGWLVGMIGQEISEEDYDRFVKAGSGYRTGPRRKVRKKRPKPMLPSDPVAIARRSMAFLAKWRAAGRCGTMDALLAEIRACDEPWVASQIKEMPYRDFLASGYWQAVRAAARKHHNYECRLCRSRSRIEVHHNTYDNHGREHRTWASDLICLCNKCHARHHGALPKAG